MAMVGKKRQSVKPKVRRTTRRETTRFEKSPLKSNVSRNLQWGLTSEPRLWRNAVFFVCLIYVVRERGWGDPSYAPSPPTTQRKTQLFQNKSSARDSVTAKRGRIRANRRHCAEKGAGQAGAANQQAPTFLRSLRVFLKKVLSRPSLSKTTEGGTVKKAGRPP